jgi:4-hydroxybenzoate polyprenyltransferase
MRVKNYFSLVKFAHTVFAMPFAMTGFFYGVNDAVFSWKLLILVLLCMVFARNAAMAFNRYIDRKFDALNARTTGREIPAGIISPKAALTFVIVNCVLFCTTAYFINMLTFVLSPVALLIVLGYSYTKRFTWLCHFVLGLGLSIAPVAAYVSVTEHFAPAPLLLSAMVLLWVGGFDILYALPDEDFDKRENLHSVPAFMGRGKALILSAVVHLFAATLAVLSGLIFGRGIWYIFGAGIFIGLLLYQHLIISPNNLKRLNAAFFTVNGIASVCYAIFAILDSLLINGQ